MKALGTLILGSVLIISPPGFAASQSSGEQQTEVASSDPGTRSPTAAALLEAVIPTAGFAYGGEWRRGLLPNALRVGGFWLFLSSVELGLFGGESE
jgi:hypothetical protein